MKTYRVIPAPRQYYVVWFVRNTDQHPLDMTSADGNWPSMNITPNKFRSRAEALKAVKKHRADWPDEVISIRRMTFRQWKKASKV